MTHPPRWTEPTLFSSVGTEYTALTIELTLHLEGPAEKTWAVLSLRDPADVGQLSIIGHGAVRLDQAIPYATELISDAIREAVRHITPF